MSESRRGTPAVRNYTHEGGWTDARIEQLRELWDAGLSASQIAAAMGRGVTRSAVIGKVHRLKMPRRVMRRNISPLPRPYRPGRELRKKMALKRSSAPRMPRQVEPSIAPEPFVLSVSAWQPLLGSTPVSMDDLTGCKWPIGDPYAAGLPLFCNCPLVSGKPYCQEHLQRSVLNGTVVEQKAVKIARRLVSHERFVPERFAA